MRAPDQTPAFPEQTRAKAPAKASKLKVETITSELDHPWAVEVLKDGRFIVTEMAGRPRVVMPDGRVLPASSGVPRVDSAGQGGLLDERGDALTLCITDSEPRGDIKNATAAACGTAAGSENLTRGLVSEGPVRLTLDGDRVTSEERFSLNVRVRDITPGPDGAIYLVTDESEGKLLKVTPAE